MKGGERDGDLSDDVVGVASARLLAAGVPASRRRQALRLLGVLESVAGPDQVVRRPVQDVAVEFGLPPHEVDGWLTDLEVVGVAERRGEQVELVAVEPSASGALRLHDFLALAAEPTAEPATVTPIRRVAGPAAGALAAALLVVAIVAGSTLPDGEPSPVAATGVGATSTTALDTTITTPVETTITQLSTDAPGAGTSTTTGASGHGTSATPGETPSAAAGATTTPEAAPTAPPTTTRTCPSEPPVVELLEMVPQGRSRLALVGIVRNPSGVAATIRSVVVHGITLPISVVAPASGSAPWEASLTGLDLPTTLSATVSEWDWIPPLPEGCPSS